MSKIAEALREALALMNDNGAHWTQGNYEIETMTGPMFCSVGAVRVVTTGNSYSHDAATDEVLAVLAAVLVDEIEHLPGPLPVPENMVIIWNDDETRSWKDVVDVFTKAAHNAEKRDL